MRACGVILSYGLVPYLPRAIKSLQGVPVYVLNPKKSWWSEAMVDKTIDMIAGIDVTYLTADLSNETEARNYAIEYCKSHGYDTMVMLDSDEVLDDIPKLLEWVENKHADAYAVQLVDYYPDEHTALPPRSHHPIVAVKLNDHRFNDKRCYDGNWIASDEIKVHHYSFLIPEQEYKKQSQLYDDAWPPIEYRNIIK